jgi:urease accessory protein
MPTAILTLIHIKDPSCASIYRCYCWLFPFPRSRIPATVPTAFRPVFHPLTGLDHLLMLAGAGVLSALSGRKLLLPFATLGMMLVGAIAGSLLGGFSGMEMLIIASLAVSGVMMFKTENRLLLAVPALAMFHGWAHGVEMSGHSFWLFTSGFMFASATVLCASFAAGLLLRRHDGLRKTFGGGLIVSPCWR